MKRKGILCFLKQDSKVLLILVDYGSSVVWNGISGFIDEDEKKENAVLREVKEEIGIDLDLSTVQYKGSHSVSDELDLDIFTVTNWEGIPESKEASIKEVRWFAIDKLPFEKMFEGNENWIPDLLK